MKVLILNLLKSLLKDPNLLAPIENLTPHALKAKKVLIKIYECVPEGAFMDFLTKYVRYHVVVNGNVVNGKLTSSTSVALLGSLKGVGTNSVIYILYHKDNTTDCYIGSASNGLSRFGQHQDCIRGLRVSDNVHKKLLIIGDPSMLMRGSIYSLTNYSKLAVSVMPTYQFSQGEIMILRATTEFILRILEQSLITQFRSTLNSTPSVIFSHTS